jgi:hypothetical protein
MFNNVALVLKSEAFIIQYVELIECSLFYIIKFGAQKKQIK